MPALNDPNASGSLVDEATYKGMFASYSKTKIDPQVSSMLAQAGLPYSFFKSLEPAVQNLIISGVTGSPTGNMALEGGQFDNAQGIVTLLQGLKVKLPTPVEQSAYAAKSTTQPFKAPNAGSTSGGGNVTINNYGPSGPAQPSAAQLEKGIYSQLKGLGSVFPFDVKPYIDKAIREGGSQDASTLSQMALDMIRTSTPYKHYFAGNVRADGTMRLSEADYQNQVNTTIAYAKANGFTMTRGQVGQQIGNDVSLNEAQYRVDAAKNVQSNADVLAGFNQVLAAQGKPTIKSAQQALNFLESKGSKDMYNIYQQAELGGAAKSAGLTTTAKEIAGVNKGVGGQLGTLTYSQIEKSYQDIAQQIQSSGAELASFGLSQQDLETIQFGGANRTSLAAKAAQALSQVQAQGQTVSEATTLTPGGKPKVGALQTVQGD